MSALLYPIYTLAHVALVFWGLRLYQQSHKPSTLILVVILGGLIYDNAIIAFGSLIGIGSLLHTLSIPRFLIHALLTPLILVVAYDLARQAGVKWLQSARSQQIVWICTAVFIIIGMLTGFLGIHLKAACHQGTVRYADRISDIQLCDNVSYTQEEINERGIPPIAAILTILASSVFAFAVWRTIRWPWMLLAFIIMIVGAAVPASRVGPWIGSGAEVILGAGLLATQMILQRTMGTIQSRSEILGTQT